MSALSFLNIIELSENVAGEFCGKLLADFGASVVKIEPPGGSRTRHMGPFASAQNPETSGLFAYLNTGKRSVTLDLRDEAGRVALRELLDQADVLIDDHAPGWLHAVGLDPELLERAHPGLVVCSVTPFGQSAPAARRHAADLTVFQTSGWGYHTPSGSDNSRPPLKGAGRFLASYEAGLDAALCIAASVIGRQANGRGGFIDISAQEVLASRVDYVLGQMVAGELDADADRRRFDLGGPSGFFPCRDGFVYVWMSSPQHWQGIAALLGQPEWMRDFPPNWLERGLTPERIAACRAHLGDWLKTQEKDAACAAAQALGVTMVPVNDAPDLLRSPQLAHRGFFTEITHLVLGPARYPTVPYSLSATPARITAPAPLLGQHNAAMPGPFPGARALARVAGKASDVPIQRRGGPLEGIRVLELTKVWAGPYAGRQLSFLGAETIRVESLGAIDVTRIYGVDDINKAPGFMAVNPQKLSVQIDMKTPEGIALLKQLLAQCDILIENLRPGAIDRLGLGYAACKAVKPDIIYVSMGMYGNDGPLAGQTGYAPCFAALGGISALVGYEGELPQGMNIRYADSTFGCVSAFAALVALAHRQRTGEGQFVDVSAVETMAGMIGDVFMDYSLNGKVTHCDGNRHAEMAPHNLYPCKDGDWIAIAVTDDAAWAALCAAMGRAELGGDAKFRSLAQRKAREPEIDRMLAEWTAPQDARVLEAQLQEAGVAAAKSANSLDLVTDEHLWARDFYRYVRHPDGGNGPVIGPSWRMSNAARISDGAPTLGQHNGYIFGEVLGIPEEEQRRLIAMGAIN